MALTPTTSIPLGFAAPNFDLPDPDGQRFSFDDVRGERGTVVVFMCNHCPYVVHILEKLVEVAQTAQDLGIGFVAISANDIQNYPQDAPEFMAELSEQHRFSFPYLYDATQEVAKAYDAACTPDFTVFDAEQKAVYRGQFDDSRPGNGKPVTGADLLRVVHQLAAGDTVPESGQIPSIGCNIKWLPGNQP